MSSPRVLVTGPVASLAQYAEAAREVGWEPIEYPLLAIEARAFERAALGSQRFDWIAITSASALSWLAQAVAASPELAQLSCLVVGPLGVERVQALGLALDMPAHGDAEELARALVQRAARGARILWPRGNLSDELAQRLRAAGLEVVDPIAYTARPAENEPAPASTAVFFASPSAVRAWNALPSSTASYRTAIAIGGTTFVALHGETAPAFLDTIQLPEPTPAAFAIVLAHLDVDRTQ